MTPTLAPIANHLWQSTLFAGVVALLALALRKNHARARHWLWLAASVKFLIPFSLLISLGNQFTWKTEAKTAVQPAVSMALQQISQPFEPKLAIIKRHLYRESASPIYPDVLLGVWLVGSAAVFLSWITRWRRMSAIARESLPLNEGREREMLTRMESAAGIGTPVHLRSSSSTIEPGIFGILRPVLLLPAGITDRLTDAQLESIFAHELSHVRRRDNLVSVVHMFVEAIFWFHPLVWWMGSRLVEERERACDEDVLRLGGAPQAYAEGILNVCKFYLESPLVCAAGVTGADLKKRIEGIMNHRIACNLDLGKKLLVCALGIGAIAGPVTIGLLSAPQGHAQSAASAAPQKFEVATIKPSNAEDGRVQFRFLPGGRFDLRGIPVRLLIQQAYNVRDFQITGGPSWMGSDRFDIAAKAETDENLPIDAVRPMFQSLLADRFKLVLHHDTKELPVYALVIGKNGIKFKESTGDAQQRRIMMGRGRINGEAMSMDMLVNQLGNQLGRTVIDKTGLKGPYQINLEWTPEQAQSIGGPDGGGEGRASSDTGPTIFTALQEQLGLKLESQKGPVDILVIDKIEKPSEN